jgi:hypothetical protein
LTSNGDYSAFKVGQTVNHQQFFMLIKEGDNKKLLNIPSIEKVYLSESATRKPKQQNPDRVDGQGFILGWRSTKGERLVFPFCT